MINFDFFLPNNLGFPHGMSMKCGLWTFHELSKRLKNFDFITFGCPSDDSIEHYPKYFTKQSVQIVVYNSIIYSIFVLILTKTRHKCLILPFSFL